MYESYVMSEDGHIWISLQNRLFTGQTPNMVTVQNFNHITYAQAIYH
jgi:hypothetical protein